MYLYYTYLSYFKLFVARANHNFTISCMEQWATEDERKESCQSRERKSFKRVGWQSMKTVRRWKLLSTNGWVEMCTTAVEFGRHRCHLAVGTEGGGRGPFFRSL